MKFFTNHLLIGTILVFCLTFNPVFASAQPDQNKKLKSLIAELETKIENADKKMIAHPSFLEELRDLVEKYKSQIRELFFKDTFNDGDYDNNPKWTVKSGEFSVNKAGRLSSFVALPTDEAQEVDQSERKKSVEAEAVEILIDSFFGSSPKNETVHKKAPQSETVQPASIYTKKTIPPAFEMNVKFKSSPNSKFDITLLGTNNLLPRYRLKIRADHSIEEPIEIVRESGSRSFTVDASNKFPVINDGEFHTLSWIRLTNGAMNVLIDGIKVLKTYEVYYRDNFTGFEITNNGGSHKWDSFTIFKALKPKEN